MLFSVYSCLVTAGDKESRVSTRQSQSGKSLPSRRSASVSASNSTLSKGSGTDKRTSGKHACIYVPYLFNFDFLIGARLFVLIYRCFLLNYSW